MNTIHKENCFQNLLNPYTITIYVRWGIHNRMPPTYSSIYLPYWNRSIEDRYKPSTCNIRLNASAIPLIQWRGFYHTDTSDAPSAMDRLEGP